MEPSSIRVVRAQAARRQAAASDLRRRHQNLIPRGIAQAGIRVDMVRSDNLLLVLQLQSPQDCCAVSMAVLFSTVILLAGTWSKVHAGGHRERLEMGSSKQVG